MLPIRLQPRNTEVPLLLLIEFINPESNVRMVHCKFFFKISKFMIVKVVV